MRTYLISYDLHRPSRDYSGLHEAIKTCGSWWHYLDSTWVVTTNLGSSDAIFNVLRPHLQQEDRVLIVRIHSTDDRQGWLPQAAWNWLTSNVSA